MSNLVAIGAAALLLGIVVRVITGQAPWKTPVEEE